MNWGTMSRDQRDAAYNNTDAVKNSAELNAMRLEKSAVFRKAHPEHLDIPYGPRERNKWDLFPAADPNAPCLVFIHGGYWQRNSREMFASLIAGPYAHGWAAALPGYTLAPVTQLGVCRSGALQPYGGPASFRSQPAFDPAPAAPQGRMDHDPSPSHHHRGGIRGCSTSEPR